MENIKLEATKYTPEISMDISGVISLKGKSYPENTFEFYEPIIKWIKDYFSSDSTPRNMTVNMEITYFNSSSSKLFFDFFDLLDENKENFEIVVNWIYDKDNESAMEAGEDFIDDFTELKINLVAK
jgi:hypothetical protein